MKAKALLAALAFVAGGWGAVLLRPPPASAPQVIDAPGADCSACTARHQSMLRQRQKLANPN